MSDIGNNCVCCNKDTSFGSGRFVNRIPADADYESLDDKGNTIFAEEEYRRRRLLMYKTFNQDSLVYFDRTEVNLKGYEYKVNDCHIELLEKDMPRLKKEIGETTFNNAREISQEYDCKTIILAQDEIFLDN
jgi:hypothetical protein